MVDQYQRDIEAALFTAIVEVSRKNDPNTAIILTGEVVSACLNIMAFFSATSEAVKTPAMTRDFCNNLARRLQKRIGAMKDEVAKGNLDFMTTIQLGDRQ